ncbi:unnamed protein product [Heligmosomoides polygyrus]|uniref:Resolvase/invertase-type recombinase catalytic domain-containing protein n=1 Tax=Heligmosomoides polygyrus TaxID=6339 RepID=A0A183F2T2_HELPZ|nr:unnamed protein product [Heligmosomoides polygyrus]
MLNELNVAGMKIGLDMNMSKARFMVNQWCDTGLVRELNMGNELDPEIARRSMGSLQFDSWCLAEYRRK